MEDVQSFAPVVGEAPRVLILGSMPGVRSLSEAQYYAHPQNAFWTVMAKAFDLEVYGAYTDRLGELRRKGFALWDVLASCRRSGSLDSAIERGSEIPNDIVEFLDAYPSIRLVGFNGRAAETLFRRHVLPTLSEAHKARLRFASLPSTSPANASLSVDQKISRWLVLREAFDTVMAAPDQKTY